MCFNSQSLLVYRVLFTELGVVSQIFTQFAVMLNVSEWDCKMSLIHSVTAPFTWVSFIDISL